MLTSKFNTASQCRTRLNPCSDADPKKETRGGANVSKTVYPIPELCCMTGIIDCMSADLTMMKEMSNQTKLEIPDLTKPLLVCTYEKEEIRGGANVSKKKKRILYNLRNLLH
ncbi:hypothetical protein TNCT_296441 [Trichonephila clavata]|uniref:Uncharacterized protein n=1 Tax=Trichonephila clavata TaxID=2740835 RepID=A0A8X6LLM4_TRICU|nr:hypothetical protein TNCT_296441 [Trichonephila clavata]